MPDEIRPKHPMPKVPDVASFMRRFGEDAACIGNLKRMLLGTYPSVSAKHLDRYLAAFMYRANRRWREATLFDRLVIAAMNAKPLTFKELTAGGK